MTDDDIRKEVYGMTHQETSSEVEGFIKGMIFMRDKLFRTFNDDWIFERDGDKVYKRKFGSDPSTRELI